MKQIKYPLTNFRAFYQNVGGLKLKKRFLNENNSNQWANVNILGWNTLVKGMEIRIPEHGLIRYSVIAHQEIQ